MKVVVFGAGAWGTALAVSAAHRHTVQLIARDPEQAHDMAACRVNRRYLPEATLPESLRVACADAAAAALIHADLFVMAAPVKGLAETLWHWRNVSVPVVWLCKGFDANGQMAHEIAASCRRDRGAAFSEAGVGVLSGPSFAREVALGQPSALVAASQSDQLRAVLKEVFHSDRLRVYESTDVVGVEVGGAVKNVLAVATGLCDGLQQGFNARAALVTRGLAEMTRLGVALGARAETFMGLSGLGDLVLTATGDLSRNRKVGLMLAQGHSTDQATRALGHVAEGVLCAPSVLARARRLQVAMPVTECVVGLLKGQISPQQAVAQLMSRDPTWEQ